MERNLRVAPCISWTKISMRGRLSLQAAVPIEDSRHGGNAVRAMLREEHRIYSEAVRIVLEGRYRIEGRRVLITAETK